jgi:hypothetical protein
MSDSTPFIQDIVLRIQLKPILEAQEKHGPIFRREIFDFAYAAWLTINNDNLKEQGDMSDDRQSITLLDIHGVKQKTFVQREGVITERHNKPCVSKRAWVYRQLQGLGLDWGEVEVDWKLLPFDFHTIGVLIEEDEDPYTPRV